MEARISIITLGVSDMTRSIRFYRDGMGFPTTAKDGDGWAIFSTRGTRFSLFPRHLLAEDAALPATTHGPGGFSGITLAHNARKKGEVDAILARAEAAGGRILKPAAKGQYIAYGGYFADPDGYAWEVAWDPGWLFLPDGEMYGGPLGPLPGASNPAAAATPKAGTLRWVATFEENARMAEVRRVYEPAHLDYLRQHSGEILIAGGLRPVPGEPYVGGMWVFQTHSRERAVELIEQDPYQIHGRRSYRLLFWGKALPDIAVTL